MEFYDMLFIANREITQVHELVVQSPSTWSDQNELLQSVTGIQDSLTVR